MSIPNEALQKVVAEIEARAQFSHQQLQIVKAQMAAKQRDQRLLQLTSTELAGLPKETRVYEGVGKMFVLESVDTVQKRIAKEEEGLKKDTEDLKKKHTYLETTFEKTQEHMKSILSGGRG